MLSKLLLMLLLACESSDLRSEDSRSDSETNSALTISYAPTILSAQSYCYYDSYYNDFIWTFKATVIDENGMEDINKVYIEIYDPIGFYLSTLLTPTDRYSSVFYAEYIETELSESLDCILYLDYNIYVTALDYSDNHHTIVIKPKRIYK